jgi:phenylacetic acid degradation operon negative regulatory protein
MKGARPQDLVFTLYGDYLLHRPGPIRVGALIHLLSALGWSAASTRTVLSRMTRKGWLLVPRGRRGEYDLSARGRRLLEAGAERIYHPPRSERWDGTWYLVSYSIPESQRKRRDQLRVRLQWLGFGQLANGLWISPHEVTQEVRALAQQLRVIDHLEVFRAAHLGFAEVEHLVAHCWDLPRINAKYRRFIAQQGQQAERSRRELSTGQLSPRIAFVRRFRLVHEYRDFPLIDPYLPVELLPADWLGAEAAALFEAYHDQLTAPAEAFVSEVLGATQ